MTTSLPPDRVAALRDRIDALLPTIVEELTALAAIPSVSLASFDQTQVDRSAEAVAALLRAEGLEVEILREGGRPAVLGRRPARDGAPTITLYAHHDVQPPGDDADWDTPPFTPTRRGDRLFGRGAADDKAGVMAHVAALRAHGANLPVGVNIFVEGEEEIGSDSLPAILDRHADKLAADAIVLADSQNWEVGVPALTTTLRGMFRVVITARTLDHAVHSGMFGGPVPDALMVLTRVLASLHDEAGDVAVQGLSSAPAPELEYGEARLRAESGLLDGVSLIGSDTILSRMWTKPSITTIGIDAPTVEKASNTLVPMARAKVSVRIAPGEDPHTAYEAFRTHVEQHVPWGAAVDVELEEAGAGFAADAAGPIYDATRDSFQVAWDGTAPVDIGVGGSIPFVASFAEKFPDAAFLVTGVEDPDSRAHGANESLHLGEFARVCLAEALLLEHLATMTKSVTEK